MGTKALPGLEMRGGAGGQSLETKFKRDGVPTQNVEVLLSKRYAHYTVHKVASMV